MSDLRSQTLAATASLVVRSIDCHHALIDTESNDVVDGLCKLWKQSFKLPVGFCFLTDPTVLESACD